MEIISSGQRLLIDLGLPLDAEENHARYLPRIGGLDGTDPSLLGVLISHPHLDHFGLLSHISPKIPVGMGAAARRIIQAAAPFLPGGRAAPSGGWDYRSGFCFNIGPFHITPFLVDHSAYDAYAFLIEGDGKRIFYSGDFRTHGRKAVLFQRLIDNAPKNIDTLFLEGSSLGRITGSDQFPTEKEIESHLVDIFSSARGLSLIHASGQNIDRMVSIFRAAKRTGKKLVIDLYTASILEATGNMNLPQSDWPDVALYVPQAQRIQVKENALFSLLKRHTTNRIFINDIKRLSEKAVLLFRPLHRFDLERGGCLDGAVYIYSQWEGYWENGAFNRLKDWLVRHSIPKVSVHTSGHASLVELKRLVNAMNPNKVVPIHSFFPEKFKEVFPHVEAHDDGHWWDV